MHLDAPPLPVFATGLFLAALGLALLSSGCGGASVADAQRYLTSGAEVVEDLDNDLAPLVTAATTRCDESTEYREDFLECMAPYAGIGWAVDGLRRTARIGQRVVDGWQAGAEDGWNAFLPVGACVAHGLSLIVGFVRLLHLDVDVSTALGWVETAGAFAARFCPESYFGPAPGGAE